MSLGKTLDRMPSSLFVRHVARISTLPACGGHLKVYFRSKSDFGLPFRVNILIYTKRQTKIVVSVHSLGQLSRFASKFQYFHI